MLKAKVFAIQLCLNHHNKLKVCNVSNKRQHKTLYRIASVWDGFHLVFCPRPPTATSYPSSAQPLLGNTQREPVGCFLPVTIFTAKSQQTLSASSWQLAVNKHLCECGGGWWTRLRACARVTADYQNIIEASYWYLLFLRAQTQFRGRKGRRWQCGIEIWKKLWIIMMELDVWLVLRQTPTGTLSIQGWAETSE